MLVGVVVWRAEQCIEARRSRQRRRTPSSPGIDLTGRIPAQPRVSRLGNPTYTPLRPHSRTVSPRDTLHACHGDTSASRLAAASDSRPESLVAARARDHGAPSAVHGVPRIGAHRVPRIAPDLLLRQLARGSDSGSQRRHPVAAGRDRCSRNHLVGELQPRALSRCPVHAPQSIPARRLHVPVLRSAWTFQPTQRRPRKTALAWWLNQLGELRARVRAMQCAQSQPHSEGSRLEASSRANTTTLDSVSKPTADPAHGILVSLHPAIQAQGRPPLIHSRRCHQPPVTP